MIGFSGFDGENYGGIYANYNSSETIAVAMNGGKWEPKALSLISTSIGKQLSVLKKVQADALVGYKASQKSKSKKGIVFQVGGAMFEKSILRFWVIGEIPMKDGAPFYCSVSYPCTFANSKFSLGTTSFKKLTVKDNFSSLSIE